MNNLTNQEDTVVRADFIVCSPDDDLGNCLCKRLQREIDDLREQLRWRTDLENSPKDGRPFEIKTSYPSVQACVVFFNGSDYESVIGTFIFPVNSTRLIGWRKIPELPEANQ